jgi:hypothetical protein
MPADRGPAFLKSHILYDMGLGVLASPHLLLCCCCRTTDRTDSDDSLTMASLKVMVMSSDQSSGFRPGFKSGAVRKARTGKPQLRQEEC